VDGQKQSPIETFADERPPLRFGAKRLYYQYSVAIPQAHLVLVSVLQGAVFGLLLQGFGLVNGFQGITPDGLIRHYFYVPYIVTSFIILIAWMDFVYASAVLIWPPSAFLSSLIFLLAVTEVLMVKSIDDIAVWVAACGTVTIVGGGLRLNNCRLFRVNDFEDKELGAVILRNEFIYGIGYGVLGVIGLLYGLGYAALSQYLVARFPGAPVDTLLRWTSYGNLLADIVFILAVDVRYRQWMLHKLTRSTVLEVTPHGGIRHRLDATSNVPRAIDVTEKGAK
jgi:hypothetical protein